MNKNISLELLKEAEILNPGNWIKHSIVTGECAKKIAESCGLDEAKAYRLGLLHDIGRRFGISDMRHIYLGYKYMIDIGYEDVARICLTHSFPYKDINAYTGTNDCSEEETLFIDNFIQKIDYDEYDKLIQLCDALAFYTGPTFIEKRLVDVTIRRGFNELTIYKWQAYLSLKKYFDTKINGDIYQLLNVKP